MKISIIVPVYNSEKYIKRCIDSILSQSYSNFELILINDGSSDSSPNILKEYEKKDKRIIVINQKNSGVSKTRNKGIIKASGDYIAFIDNDDYIEKDYLLNFVKNSADMDIVIGGYKRVNDKKILLKKIIKNSKWGKFENMAPWSKIIKKELLIKNNIRFFPNSIGEDIIFNLNLYSRTNKIKIISNTDYNWYFNDKSVSNTSQRKFDKDIIKLFNEMKKFDNTEDTSYFILRYAFWYLLFSGHYASSSEFIDEYNKIWDWINKNHYTKSINLFKIIKNESSIKNIIIISIFYIIVNMHLLVPFSKIYCKG